MNNRTYGDLFKLVRSLAGVGSFAPSEVDDVENIINRRFAEAYNTSPIWPRYLVPSEERKISAFVTSGITDEPTKYNRAFCKYGVGNDGAGSIAAKGSNVYIPIYKSQDINLIVYKNTSSKWVFGAGDYNRPVKGSDVVNVVSATSYFTQNETDDHKNPLDVLDWNNNGVVGGQLFLDGANLIPFEETRQHNTADAIFVSKTKIGSFQRIYRTQSFLNQSALEYDFFVDANGANILNINSTGDESAFVTYKKPFIPFNVTTNHSTSTELVPGEFFEFIAHAAYADFLRMDGQTDKALAEEQRAQVYLALELERVDIMSNNNTINKRFSTYVNRQSR